MWLSKMQLCQAQFKPKVGHLLSVGQRPTFGQLIVVSGLLLFVAAKLAFLRFFRVFLLFGGHFA
jgi:hypothetical protein